MTTTTNKRVIITKPDDLLGKVGVLDGDRFKYPSQSFWVQPVLLEDGSKVLALSYEECMDPIPIKPKVDPLAIYDYQQLLSNGVCRHCSKKLEWTLEVRKNDDRFCTAVCCLTSYSMVPDQVRLVTDLYLPEVPYLPNEKEGPVEEAISDDDFLRELSNMK